MFLGQFECLKNVANDSLFYNEKLILTSRFTIIEHKKSGVAARGRLCRALAEDEDSALSLSLLKASISRTSTLFSILGETTSRHCRASTTRRATVISDEGGRGEAALDEAVAAPG